MNGITIIEEHLCREVELSGLIGFAIIATILCCGGAFVFKLLYNQSPFDKTLRIFIWCASIVLSLAYVAAWVSQINGYNKVHTEYTVVVDDAVSFNDFHAKYEIISVNGNEYRVVEK